MSRHAIDTRAWVGDALESHIVAREWYWQSDGLAGVSSVASLVPPSAVIRYLLRSDRCVPLTSVAFVFPVHACLLLFLHRASCSTRRYAGTAKIKAGNTCNTSSSTATKGSFSYSSAGGCSGDASSNTNIPAGCNKSGKVCEIKQVLS